MKKNLFLVLLAFLCTTNLLAKKIPADFLDSNVAFIYQSKSGIENEKLSMTEVAEWLKEQGINLVACDDLTGALEGEKATYDYSKKNVKYIISYFFAGSAYIPVLHVYEPQIIPSKRKKLLDYKEGRFIAENEGSTSNVFSKLEKRINKFKKKNPTSNQSPYDSTLIGKKLYTEEEIKMFQLKEDALTFKWLIPKSFEETIPADLATEKLSFLKVIQSGTDAISEAYINMKILSALKEYPYSYKEYNNFDEYLSDPEKSKIKYRLFLFPNGKVYNSGKFETSVSKTAGKPFLANQLKIEPTRKILSAIILYDTYNDKYYKVSDYGFAGDAMRHFNSKLPKKKKK